MASETKPTHLPFLDGIRGAAAVYVLLHHAFLVSLKPLWANPHGMARIAGIVFDMGHFAVGVFIVLSGFSLMLPVVLNGGELPGGAFRFFQKRARRILPPYYLCLLFSFFLIYVVPEAKLYRFAPDVTSQSVLTHLLLIHDFWPETSNKINPVLWSVAVEWRIYLVFPLLVWLWRRCGALLTTLLFLVMSGVLFALLMALHVSQGSTPTGICPQYLGLFALGTLAAGVAFSPDRVCKKMRETIRWDIITVVCLGLVILSMKYPTTWGKASIFFNDIYIGGFISCLFIHLTKAKNSIGNRFWESRPLVFLGIMAYSIYLMHMPLQVFLLNYVIAFLPLSDLQKGILFMTFGTVVILVGCWLFYRMCERPFVTRRAKPEVSAAVA